jgi:hypothetical protein
VLINLKHIKTLLLNLRSNEIDVDGAELLFMGFSESVQLQHLNLNLEQYGLFPQSIVLRWATQE